MAMAIRHFVTVASSFLMLRTTCEGTVQHVVEPIPGASFVESVEVPQASSAGGVPALLYVRAITSLPFQYRDALAALDEHLAEEHRIFSAESPEILRPHLCCADYSDGPAFKSALTAAAAQHGGGVRSALNRPEGYCALAHVSSATAARVESEVYEGARCSPLTHASKEPTSLLAPGSKTLDGDPQEGDLSVFGIKLGASLQDGAERGLIVTMSPGALPLDKGNQEQQAEESDGEGRKLRGADGAAWSRSQSAVSETLQRRWKSVWNSASAESGIGNFSETISWTSSKRRGENSGIGRRVDAQDAVRDVGGVRGWGSSPSYHGAKVAGYKAALVHLGRKMEDGAAGQGSGLSLMEACGWGKMAFVHGRNDVLYLRGIHDERHDEEMGAACFLALVGFLSSQPDVLHIHPEAKVEANNKILTAYMEGGEELETPIRDVGLNGMGEVIGVTDTGLDDNSCFFRDDVHGMVPRWVHVVDGVEDARVFDPMVGSREVVFLKDLKVFKRRGLFVLKSWRRSYERRRS